MKLLLFGALSALVIGLITFSVRLFFGLANQVVRVLDQWFHKRFPGLADQPEQRPDPISLNVHIGDRTFVGIVGDNAQGVLMGHRAGMVHTTDSQVIAVAIDALRASGRTQEAAALQALLDISTEEL